MVISWVSKGNSQKKMGGFSGNIYKWRIALAMFDSRVSNKGKEGSGQNRGKWSTMSVSSFVQSHRCGLNLLYLKQFCPPVIPMLVKSP
jgi:hypothetical protein